MEIEILRLFADVAERGNFASAARSRNIDPSSVSRSIANLEQELAIRLFQRSTRKLSLTEAGLTYLRRIQPILLGLENAQEEARNMSQEPRGTLRFTASVAFGEKQILPLLSEFRELYPAIKLELLFTDHNLELLKDNIDLACRLTPEFSSEMIGIKLFATRYFVCASPRYLRKTSVIRNPADLAQHDCLVFNMPLYRSRWLFRSAESAIEEIKIRSNFTVTGALALRQSALMHLGPALLPDWLIQEDLEKGHLVDLFPQFEVTATDFDTAAWLLYPSKQFLANKTRVMVDFLKSRLSRSGNEC